MRRVAVSFLGHTLLLLLLPYSQAQDRETLNQQNPAVTRPEAIAGKYYSRTECVQIARWVIRDEKNLRSLTGLEVGDFWYTLDSCGFLHFSDPKTMYERPSAEQIDLEIAIDWATHAYIERLVNVIESASSVEKDSLLSGLRETARTTKGDLLLSTVAASGPTEPPALPPTYDRVVRIALPHDLNPRDSVACVGAHNDKGELYDLGCNTSMEHDPMVGIYRVEFSENPDGAEFARVANVAGSAWKCHFAASEVTLICERIKK
jgi:hypothetical protein